MDIQTDNKTILVVDDDPLNLEVLAAVLKDDYSVKLAKNGDIALKITEQYTPDLILLDVMMPIMDGYEVCEKLKQNPATKDIPVIFVTAKDHDTDEAKGFELGAVDYITKPANPVLIKARVKTHLILSEIKKLWNTGFFEKPKNE